MLNSIMYVTLYVTDQDMALGFYTEGLGLEKRVDYPGPEGRFLTVGVPNSPVEIILWQGEPASPQAEPGTVPGPVFPESDDLRQEFESLRARGVTFAEPEPGGLPVRRPHHCARPGWQPHRAPPATLTWSRRKLITRPAWPTPPDGGHATDLLARRVIGPPTNDHHI